MRRVTTHLLVLALAGAALIYVPVSASAGGCEVLQDVQDRAQCVARQQARDQARAEVRSGSHEAGANTSQAWDRARNEADGVHVDELVNARLLAAIGGSIWLWVVVRRRRRRHTTTQ